MLYQSAANTAVTFESAASLGHCAAPVWSLVIRGFLLWSYCSSQERRAQLKDDLQMMVMLLQQTSGTIEELRVRLVTVRMYGLIRRQVFVAWRKFIEDKYARQIANATYSANSSVSQQGDDLGR